jgi:hypothetical protein
VKIMSEQAQNFVEKTTRVNVSDVAERVNDIGKQVEAGLNSAARRVKSEISGVNFTESTVPDMFRGMPKFISPRLHRWLDVAVTGYFAMLGAFFASRGRKGAATAAFVNAGMVAGVSMLTDYEGNGRKPISSRLHGTMDAVQAAAAVLAPVLHGFAREPESAFFYGQAANELAVIASTDWDRNTLDEALRRAA